MSTEGPGTRTSFESVGSQMMAFSPIVLRKKDSEQTGNGRIDLILEASNQMATEVPSITECWKEKAERTLWVTEGREQRGLGRQAGS